jgi:hypothetical protein
MAVSKLLNQSVESLQILGEEKAILLMTFLQELYL